MSMMIIAALSAASASITPASTIGPADWPAVAAAARRMDVPASILYRSLTARQTPRRTERDVRFCISRAAVVDGKSGHVCRSRRQWASFGISIPSHQG